ncbi:D-alanyl-D-alanine carboxypeptidase [Candidatus Falkowbacteria bacterium]|nr:D-alanyl-D-alanine carboxypeptidase [Candidatus Falkowbacteria bacterium]
MLKVIVNILIASFAGQIGIGEIGVNADDFQLQPIVAGIWTARGPERINKENQGLKLTAESVLAVDKESFKVLFEKNADKKVSIASISKLATILVFLDTKPDLEKIVYMTPEDEVGGARIRVARGESLRVEDLFYSSLIASANNAVMALVHSTGMTEKEFMIKMNRKVKDLEMADTYLAEPTGLNMVNHSTARDVAHLIKAALEDERIVEALKMKEYSFRTVNTGRWVKANNTDKLLSSFLNNGDGYEILGGKTGYTVEAGYCLAAGIKGKEGQEIIGVVLGSGSNYVRFQEMKGLAWWVFNNWQW